MATIKPTHEPVAYSNIVTAVLTGLVTAGWITVPSTTIDAIATGVGLAFAGLTTVLARFGVIPTAKLKASEPSEPVVKPAPPGESA